MIDKNMKKEIFTVPNALSFLRILLVPFFAFFYFFNKMEYHFIWAAAVLVLSGLTDILDGMIARKFNMISSFGKIIDPLADKLTQGTAAVCLSIRHPIVIPLLILFCAKEFTMLLGAVYLFKMGLRPSESKWWGKLGTVMMFLLIVLVIISDITVAFPLSIIVSFEVVTAICLLFSLFNYYPLFKEIQTGEYDINTESRVTDSHKNNS